MSDRPPPPPPPPPPSGGGHRPDTGGDGPRWQAPSEPPPPPPPASSASPGGARPPDEPSSRTGLVVGIVVAVLVLAGVGWAAVALLDDDPAPVAGPTTTPDTPPTTSSPTPAPSTPGGLDDLLGDGGLEDLLGEGGLEDLLGDQFDPQLLACLSPPDGGQPSLQGTPLPDDPEEAIRTIGDQVEQLRSMQFREEVDLELLTGEELAERVGRVVEEDYQVEDADVDQAIYSTLGQLPDDLDLLATYRDLLTEQVAGFYDPESGELVAQGSADLAPTDRIIVAHELDHALVDQVVGLPDLSNESDLDAVLARQGLAEGDATVLMQQWATAHLSLTEQLGMAVPQADTEALDSAPHVLRQQLLYPYTTGMSFVCSQYADGGWDAVDAAYQDPPTTTAQVLWPERYDAGEQARPVPDVTLPDAREVRTTTWGAADLLWLLEAPGNDPSAALPDPEERARDWAGGTLTAWDSEPGTTVTLQVAQRPDGALCATFQRWHEAAFPQVGPTRPTRGEQRAWEGDGRAASLTCDDDLVTMTVGTDLATVRAVESG